MRIFIISIQLLISSTSLAQVKKTMPLFSFGLDYRQYPIDVEDVPRGPSPRDNGLPGDDGKFWQTLSLHGRIGLSFKRNWLFSVSVYGRYNQLHQTQGINYGSLFPQKVRSKKNFKNDLFLDLEKKFRIKKNRDRYLFASGGIGFTNINSRWNFVLTDTSFGNPYTKHYQGTHFNTGPRLSLGYQYNNIKISIDGYVIEDPIKANLTSLWLGSTLSYEIHHKKKTVKTEVYKKPDAAVYYKQSITRKKIGLSLLAPTALLFLLGRTNLDVNSPNYGNDRSGFTYAGVITGGTAFYCLISSRHQLKKSKRINNNPVY